MRGLLTPKELLCAMREAGIVPRIEDAPEMKMKLMIPRHDRLPEFTDAIREHRDELIWLLAVESVADLPPARPSKWRFPDTPDESWEEWQRLLAEEESRAAA